MVGEREGPIDLEDVGQRILRQMDERVDRELARISAETSSALSEISKEASGQLKQSHRQMEKLRAQASEGQARTERVERH